MEQVTGAQTCLQCEELARLFHRAAKIMARTYHRHSHVFTAQAHVYAILKEKGSMSQADLLQLLDVRSSSLSEVLGKLEQNGLISRTRNENDKRSFVISVNDDVTPHFPDHGRSNDKGADALFACLDELERNQLGSLLLKVIEAAGGEGEQLEHEHRHKHHSHDRKKPGGRGGGKKLQHRTAVVDGDASGKDGDAGARGAEEPRDARHSHGRGKGKRGRK